jgi:internalin A
MTVNGGARSDFVIEERAKGRVVVVTGDWSNGAAELLRTGKVDALELNRARGFRETTLEFLDESFQVRWLLVLDRQLRDVTPLERLGGSLEELRIETAPDAAVYVSRLPHLRTIAASWRQVVLEEPLAASLRQLIVGEYDAPDLHAMSRFGPLTSINLQSPHTLSSLDGIERLTALRELRISLALKLKSIAQLSRVQELVHVEFEGCPGVNDLTPFAALSKLRFVGFSNCGAIQSLRPLAELVNIEELHAWGTTRVIDNDLSTLSLLPRLREVRMRDRTSYRPRLRQLLDGLSL